MNDFVAAMLVLMALAAVGNFASDEGAMSQGCGGGLDVWVSTCR